MSQQQLQRDDIERDILWRDVTIENLEKEITEVAGLFNDFAELVEKQDSLVSNINDNIENSIINTETGVQNITVAKEQQDKSYTGIMAIMASSILIGGGALAGLLLA